MELSDIKHFNRSRLDSITKRLLAVVDSETTAYTDEVKRLKTLLARVLNAKGVLPETLSSEINAAILKS